jgi:hypothetical protein
MAHCHDFIAQLTMGALALRRQTALNFGPRRRQAAVSQGTHPFFGTFLDSPVGIVVATICCPARAIHRPLDAAQGAPRLLDAWTQALETGFFLTDYGDGRRTYI